MNKTPLYYASTKRKNNYGWQKEIGNVLNYEQLTKGDNRSKGDREMQNLVRKANQDAEMRATEDARRSQSKQPCSLTLAQENLARARFKTNKIRGHMSRETRDLVDIVSENCNGLIDNANYHRFKKLLAKRDKQNTDYSQLKNRDKSIPMNTPQNNNRRNISYFKLP